jgi:chromosome segregation ATPase
MTEPTPLSLNFPKVNAACDEIAKLGLNPTATKVRDIIGSGSNRDIQLGIDEWRSTLAARISYLSAYPEIDPEIVSASAKIFKLANTLADARLKDKKNELLEQQRKSELETAALQEKLEKAQSVISNYEVSTTDLESTLKLTKDTLANLKVESRAASDQLITLKGEAGKNTAIITELRANIQSQLKEAALLRTGLIQEGEKSSLLSEELSELKIKATKLEEALSYSQLAHREDMARHEKEVQAIKDLSEEQTEKLRITSNKIIDLNELNKDLQIQASQASESASNYRKQATETLEAKNTIIESKTDLISAQKDKIITLETEIAKHIKLANKKT